jgi:hypothetical protein
LCKGQIEVFDIARKVLRQKAMLEIFRSLNTVYPCRFTNFTAKNAARTAKSWCVHLIGAEPNAPIAGQAGWTRNFPPLLRPVAAAMPGLVRLAAAGDVAAVVAVGIATAIELQPAIARAGDFV